MGVNQRTAILSQTEEFLLQLRGHIAAREVGSGIACLEAHRHFLDDLDPRQENAARVVAHLAVWVDIGFDGLPRLVELLNSFQPKYRSKLSIADYVYLRMAEGMVALREEAIATAISHFDFVLGLGEELDDEFLLAIVNFWKGRCLRRRGEYDEALIYTSKGRDMALELGHQRMAAVMKVLESWLLFQQGKPKEAARLSHEAEIVLQETDDYVTLGNIQSFYGRMARREGRYDKAIELFERAIELYGKRDPQHPNLARSLANMALAKREIALQLQRKIDQDVERRRKTPSKTSGSRTTQRTERRERLNSLRREALQHLETASAIYAQHPNHHGVGMVHLNAAYIHLDSGDFQHAEVESARAYELAEAKRDYILMGRARILECMIENAKVEEELTEGADAGSHARRALECIQEAVDLAKHTQAHSLLASAYIWQGMTHCNSFFDNPDAARESHDLARSFSKGNQSGHLWQELQTLRSRILHKGTVDPNLKAWSLGAVGDKTFKQITDEFADIVIPRVWEREGRKVSRVAARLSISPKKVRRILDRVGRRKRS
jgi:tetratricopeptide (TPR) repeat protein